MKRFILFLSIALIGLFFYSCQKQPVDVSYHILATSSVDLVQSTVVTSSLMCSEGGQMVAYEEESAGTVLLILSSSKDMMDCETLQVENHPFNAVCSFVIDVEKRPLNQTFWYYIEMQAPYSTPIRSAILKIPPIPKGAFMAGDGEFIFFASGNLQYQASSDTWRFAENQYDVIGEDNQNISSVYNGYIDLFGFGTSGYSYEPYFSTLESSYYAIGDISHSNNDWGIFCSISNGENYQWRTPENSDWEYIVNGRPNADKKRGFAVVNGVSGYLLLPEVWHTPVDCSFNPDDLSNNNYDLAQWQSMESAGAVFLPATGYRIENDVKGMNIGVGSYFSSSWATAGTNDNGVSFSAQPIRFYFDLNSLKPFASSIFIGEGKFNAYGSAIRLIRTAQNSSE